MRTIILFAAIGLLHKAMAHGGHEQGSMLSVPEGADWATRHMIEEHHIENFDSTSFFKLHDYDSSGEWTVDDIAKTYGLLDVSTGQIEQQTKLDAIEQVLQLFDRDRSHSISLAEYVIGVAAGRQLPDFGFGPGHHGDIEYEYEIHHFEKYHGPDAKLEDLTHEEDIEHFRMHDQLEEQAERQAMLDRMEIVAANIPMKFRRAG